MNNYYDKNKDKILDYQNKYNKNNKDKLLDYHNKYYQKNKEILIAKQKEYYENNKQRYSEYYAKKYKHLDYKKKLELKEYNRLYYLNKTLCKKRVYKKKIKQEGENIYYEPLTTIAKGKFIIEL